MKAVAVGERPHGDESASPQFLLQTDWGPVASAMAEPLAVVARGSARPGRDGAHGSRRMRSRRDRPFIGGVRLGRRPVAATPAPAPHGDGDGVSGARRAEAAAFAACRALISDRAVSGNDVGNCLSSGHGRGSPGRRRRDRRRSSPADGTECGTALRAARSAPAERLDRRQPRHGPRSAPTVRKQLGRNARTVQIGRAVGQIVVQHPLVWVSSPH